MSDPSSVAQHTVTSQLPHPCLPCAVTVVLSIVIFIVTYVLLFLCMKCLYYLFSWCCEMRMAFVKDIQTSMFFATFVWGINYAFSLVYWFATLPSYDMWKMLLRMLIRVNYTNCATATMGFILISCNHSINLLSTWIPFLFFSNEFYFNSVSEYECDHHLHRNLALAICSCFTPVLFQWSSYSQLLSRTKGTQLVDKSSQGCDGSRTEVNLSMKASMQPEMYPHSCPSKP